MSGLIVKTFDLKAAESADGQIEAYITTFKNADYVGDIIMHGALDEFIKNFDPEVKKLPMFYEHDSKAIIGEWNALEADEYGVKGKGILYTETTKGADVQALLKRKAVASVSIGFRSNDYEVLKSGGRQFNSLDLVETSIVLNPANDLAKIISVKSEDGMIEVKALKTLLKEAGLNRAEITALFDGGWKNLINLRNESTEKEMLIEALTKFKL